MYDKNGININEFVDQWGHRHLVAIDTQTGFVFEGRQNDAAYELCDIIHEMRRILRRNSMLTLQEARRAAEDACAWKSNVRREQKWGEQIAPGMFTGRIREMLTNRD